MQCILHTLLFNTFLKIMVIIQRLFLPESYQAANCSYYIKVQHIVGKSDLVSPCVLYVQSVLLCLKIYTGPDLTLLWWLGHLSGL